MNISVKQANSANKWAVLAASTLLMTGVVAGCGNKGGDVSNTSGATTTGTTTTDLSGSDVVATVNGENITRGDMYPLMVAATGDATLTDLINYQMVMQELKKSNLTVSEADIDAFLADRKTMGGAQAAQLAQIVKEGGVRLTAIRRRAQLQVAMEKLVTKDVKADPAAVKAWFTKNQNNYAVPARIKLGLLVASTKVRADTMAAQLKAKTKTFQQLVDEQKKSGDPAGRQSSLETPEVAVDSLSQTFGPVLAPVAQKMSTGGISPVVSVGKGAFLILTVVSKTAASKPDFVKLQEKATNDYKLETLAREQVAKNPGGQKFEQVLKQIETAISQQSQQQGNFTKPSYHDLLGVLNQSKVQEIQTKMRDAAKVVVSDNDFKKVGEQFKPSPTPDASITNSATSNSTTSNSAATAAPPANAPANAPAKP